MSAVSQLSAFAEREQLQVLKEQNMNQTDLPSAFADRMKTMLGEEEFGCFLSSYASDNRKALRANLLKLSREELKAMVPGEWDLIPVPWEESGACYATAEDVRPGKHPYHEMGLYYMQEPSAMAVAAFSGAARGERILDLCAAPGGKSTQLAAAMQGKGILISNEIHPARAKILSQNIERIGARNVIVTNETPQHLAERFPGYFDRVVVDAPCSGEGMFRKEEQAIPMWSPENVTSCALRQQEILDAAARMVCPGGTLVYSTCTFAPEEDEAGIGAFLKKHPDFSVDDLPGELGDKMEQFGFCRGNREWVKMLGEEDEEILREIEGSLRLWPHRLKKPGGEGHFLCRMKRAGIHPHPAEAAETSTLKKKKGKAGKTDNTAAEYLEFEKAALTVPFLEQCSEDTRGKLIRFGEEIYLEPEGLSLAGLKVLRPGLHLGTLRKNRFEPSHALALALKAGDVRSSYACTEPEMQAYQRGDSIPCERELAGWTLMLLDGFPAGWAKAAGGMLKNHYPRGLRKN